MCLSGSNYKIFTTIYIHYTPKQRNIRIINKHSHHTFRCTAYSDFLVIIHLPIERPLPLPKVSINCTVIWYPDSVLSELGLGWIIDLPTNITLKFNASTERWSSSIKAEALATCTALITCPKDIKANSDDVLNDEADKLAKLGATSPYIIIINKDIDTFISTMNIQWATQLLFNTLTCFHRNQELGSSRHLWTCHHNFLLNAILYSNGYQTSTGLPSRIYHWYTRYCLEFFKKYRSYSREKNANN
ncbi:hypothetical protein RIR_jg7821.t1 [Rhizophagus irregularis DAOM 181602=DAOM 197198]|nr:hypothetical protein RIR_jg7821.t1 [Rhizophagus irregularis DAOM 181602=DAOM 197198]